MLEAQSWTCTFYCLIWRISLLGFVCFESRMLSKGPVKGLIDYVLQWWRLCLCHRRVCVCVCVRVCVRACIQGKALDNEGGGQSRICQAKASSYESLMRERERDPSPPIVILLLRHILKETQCWMAGIKSCLLWKCDLFMGYTTVQFYILVMIMPYSILYLSRWSFYRLYGFINTGLTKASQ